MNCKKIQTALRKQADSGKSKILQRFFKTGKGQYAEGDLFLGLTVPQTRQTIRDFKDLSLAEIQTLLKSNYHEERLAALLLLVHAFKKGDDAVREKIYTLYLNNTKYINNWDLVDLSAEHIVGGYLEKKNKSVLTKLARSKNLWERRIAMLATFHYIKQGHSEEALNIAELLLKDEHDLIHKAVGWMLREVGKRCSHEEEEIFLFKHYHDMPRTMLRYAIERFPEPRRKAYLQGTI